MSTRRPTLTEALNEAPLGLFHLRAMVTAGVGFFTDAYDLFIIGVALVLIKQVWHPSSYMLGLVGSTSLIAAFLGAFIFGRLADVYGRKAVYGLEAALMALAALASALAPNILWLIIFRFILGVGIGGDYPVSAVLMSEYANTRDRGKLVGMVFSMQALGLVAGPIVALTILGAGASPDLAWRLMLGLGALPALGIIYLRRTMPESPRYLARVKGETERAVRQMEHFSAHAVEAETAPEPPVRARLGRYLVTLVGTAGTWFVFDYAYYGNSISTPLIMKMVAPHAALATSIAWTLIVFAVAAVPGYILAFSLMDRIGHRKLQLIGFAVMGLAFLAIGAIPGLTRMVVPFLLLYGLSYFFAEFGPNVTTFVLAAELYPVNLRTTGHGLSAGVAKVGAFIGVFVFPVLAKALGLAGTLEVTFGFSVVGFLLTLLLPEPARQDLETISGEDTGHSPAAAHLG
ncbi:MFS domain-containing protein [Candidatus Hydrogenisulfobacillus filiaventi]|uniref:MFS domain-containing protein n=1 Tax=Candidatus Hydrogenisulfobacillus filiaventi TaxID=2707344 RepID=A0A6F8ZDX3_9FIRM|nr:MFS domain-containing protein [Candidatus Hydrogenisulfobacillus filiaventi]